MRHKPAHKKRQQTKIVEFPHHPSLFHVSHWRASGPVKEPAHTVEEAAEALRKANDGRS